MTGEARFADVVLPAATDFEIKSYQHYPGYVRLREPVIQPVGQARNNFLILAGLAGRLGYGDCIPQSKTILEMAFSAKPESLAN